MLDQAEGAAGLLAVGQARQVLTEPFGARGRRRRRVEAAELAAGLIELAAG